MKKKKKERRKKEERNRMKIYWSALLHRATIIMYLCNVIFVILFQISANEFKGV